MGAPAENIDGVSVVEAARIALTDANGDVKAATDMLLEAVRQSVDLRQALTEPLLAVACYEAVCKETRKLRRTVWSAPNAPEDKRDQARRVVHLAAGTLLMFPLPGGKPLKEATRAEILHAADFYARQARDMGQKETWLRLVAQHLPDDRVAGEVMTNNRLAELQTEATRDA